MRKQVEFGLCMDDGTWLTKVFAVPSELHAILLASGNPDPLIVWAQTRANLSRKVACVFVYNDCPEGDEPCNES